MSSGQGDTATAKADDDTELNSPNEHDKLASKDQVDHISESSLDKVTRPFQELVTEDPSNKTDSGFKDNVLTDIIDKTKSGSDNTDDNSDDDLELKWDDDETDEQNISLLENIQKISETVSDIAKPMVADIDDANLSSTDAIGEKTDEIDENKLLESSPSNNEDTNLSSTSDLAETNLPISKIDENEGIAAGFEDVIDENKLLEGPESDTVDEAKLLEISDENKEDSLSNDDLSQIDLNSLAKTVVDTSDNVALSDIAKETSCLESLNLISSTQICDKKPQLAPTKSVNTENMEKAIIHLESTSPIQDKSHLALSQSSPKDSVMDTTLDINTEHGLNKPDMMLEIPTQEIIELIDDTDISASETYNDDKMDVDDANDSSKLDTSEYIDKVGEGKSTLEVKADAVILKPADVFRALNTQTPSKDASNEANKMEDVSEDDWCEIERRLEGFEDSINEESQPIEQSTITDSENVQETKSKDDVSSTLKDKPLSEEAATETLPLTNAQKLVIESENKELLKTLQDTSKLDCTEDEISTTMDVEDEILANPVIEGKSIEPSIESTLDIVKDDIPPKTDLESNLDITQSNNKNEVNSDLEHQHLESLKPDTKASKPMSPLKLIEEMEAHEGKSKAQLESSKPDTKESTIDLSPPVDEKTTESLKTLTVHELAEVRASEIIVQKSDQTDKVAISEPIEIQVTTNQSNDKVLSSTHDDIPAEAKSLLQLINGELKSETSITAIEDKDKSKPTDKIENKLGEELMEVDVESLTSKLHSEDDAVDIASTLIDVPLSVTKSVDDKIYTPSTEIETAIHDQRSTNGAQATLLKLPSTTKSDSEGPSIKLSGDIEVTPSISVNDNPSTLKHDSLAQSAPKPFDDIKVQPSTPKVPGNIEVQPSTPKISDDIVAKPVTLKISDDIEAQPSSSKIPDDIEVQPSTSKIPDDIEAQPSSLKTPNDIEVQPSTSKTPDDIEVQPSSSKILDDIEVQPSTSKIPDDIEPQPSTSSEVPIPSVEPINTDPDSADDVAETSDSLGLLAESSRVMEDDEEQDEDDDADADADDDDDYDPEDESSNQMTAEHSEDSNAPHSETDQAKDEKEMEIESPLEEKGEDEFSFTAEEKDGAIADDKDVSMDIDEEVVQDVIEVTAEQVGNEAIPDDVEASDTVAETKEEDKEKPKETVIEKVEPSDASAKESKSISMLRKLLAKDEEAKTSDKKLGYKEPHVLNIVDLEGSSSEDDIQEVKKDAAKDGTLITFDGFKITIPSSVDVSSVPTVPEVASEETVTTDDKNGENTAKTDSKPAEDKPKPKFSLEIFSLDSDEEENASAPATEQKPLAADDVDKAKHTNKCVNIACTSSGKVPCYPADAATVSYYDAAKRRKPLVCQACADIVVNRTQRLVNGIKDITPLLELDTCKLSSELVEISDSESEDETDTSDEPRETIGEIGASFLEANLAKMINETWTKFCLDSRLAEAQDDLDKEMEKLDAESKEIDAMLTECQVATDKLRNDLYATFEQRRRDLGAITIYDTPVTKYSCVEKDQAPTESAPETRAKRRMSSATETPAKRPAIPLGYTPINSDTAQAQDNKVPTVENTKADDDKDISVLKVSAESAPSDLPPPGELTRPPLRVGMCVYAMRNAFGSWLRTRVLEVNGKSAVLGMSQTFTVCRIKYEHKPKGSTKLAPARCLAYSEPATVRLTIGTRIIALFKDSQNPLKKDAFYSGIISEVPNPVNNYRYLVFFDDGYAQYVQHRDTRVVCESSSLVWEEVHPFSREFVREYLLAYPERPMVRLHAGQSLKTEWNGKWWTSRVIQVDASLVQVHFEEDNRTEWIYRGSTRLAPLFLELQAAERHRARPMPRTKAQPRLNMPYVEYTRSDEQNKSEPPAPQAPPISEKEIRQRAVAKKSTALPPAPNFLPPISDSVTSRVVYYTPKNAVKPYKMTPHTCGPHCKRKDVLALKDLRTYNPLAKPLLSGWERQIVRYKGHKEVMYRAPCGRRLRSLRELHHYLRVVQADMAVDLFDFTPHTHCLAEFVLNKCLVGKKDLSHGKENVPVPCVNYYDESLPEFCSYNTERTPTAGVPLNLDPAFLCGCDCTDDCEDKSKCACWQMTLEGARTIGLNGPNVGYKYKRLPEPLPSGIYECNSRCKCKHTCLNRVAQHPLQLKLQVFKTLNRGWGIRALNDIPKGSFLCVYAGNLLTDATANMDGLNEGDEYLAELDYIEVVEQMKEGFEEDIPEADKRLDKKGATQASSESEESSSEEESGPSKDEQEDGDFCPGYIGMGVSEFSKRLRKRDKSKKKNKQDGGAKEKEKDGDKPGDDCITISDDEEVREPSSFMAKAGMGKEFISKYRSVRSYFGKDEACYIMDAKVQGNIGRYLNHSCQPNVFVQNVFVDTHDPRFPWVAFFALSHIKAGSELTWNYNYDVGSVPGKVLYCYCGAPNCRGRLL